MKPGFRSTALRQSGQSPEINCWRNNLLRNSFGIGANPEIFSDSLSFSEFDALQYAGTEAANFSIYISPLDLTPGLFVQALSGSSIYGDVPVNPGISLVSGMLEEGDTIGTIGLTTDFNLTQLSPAGDYTININATNLDEAYRLVGSGSGTFTINPAPLTITTFDQTKVYGQNFVFNGNEFSVAGLKNTK